MALLLVERGVDKDRKVELKQDRVIRLGRSQDCDLVLKDPMISRQHFEVEGRDGNFYIRDQGSTNGTFLNGERLEKETRLEIGDRIEAGDTLLSFIPHERWRRQDTVTGRNIAGYLILERIGRGGMGTVYKALQLSLDRTVALKILSKNLCKDRNFIEMFVREARSAGQLNHPNIVHVYDVGKWEGVYYLSMEYMVGGSLADLVRRQGRVRVANAIPMMTDAAHGLEYAERRGIVHRDIKPDNLMLSEEGVVKIGDLGIARQIPARGSVKDQALYGSPLYMSPEQARCAEVDHRADIYSLGVTFYQILSGRTPFSGSTVKEIIIKQVKEEPPPLKEVAPDVPDSVCEVVHRMLKKNPAERYQNAGEVIKALETIKKSVRAVRRAFGPQVPKKRLFMLVGVLGAVVVACLVAALAWISWREAAREAHDRLRKGYGEALKRIEAAAAAPVSGRTERERHRARLKALAAAIEMVGRAAGEYEAVEGATARLREVEASLREGIDAERKRYAEAAQRALKAAEEFYDGHVTATRHGPMLVKVLEEAGRLFAGVVSNYGDTEEANLARTRLSEVRDRCDRFQVESESAEREAKLVENAVARLAAQNKYRQAKERIDAYPARLRVWPAWRALEALRKRVLQGERGYFMARRAEIERMIEEKRFPEAERAIRLLGEETSDESAQTGLNELKAALAAARDRLREEQKQRLLREDANVFAGAWSKARDMSAQFDFDGAAHTMKMARIRLKSDDYRRLADTAMVLVKRAEALQETLVRQIAGGGLSRVVRLKFGVIEARVRGADASELHLEYDEGELHAELDRRWRDLSVAQLRKLYGAMRMGAHEEMGLAAFLVIRGLGGEAETHWSRALELDGTMKDEVDRCREFMKWLK